MLLGNQSFRNNVKLELLQDLDAIFDVEMISICLKAIKVLKFSIFLSFHVR